MSRISNLTTIKIGIFKSWNGYWFDKIHYSSLLFNDLKIRDYLSGIFYHLKIISDYIYIYRLLNNTICINTNLIFFSNLKFKSLTLKKVYKMNEQYIFFYRKRHWLHFINGLSLLYKLQLRNLYNTNNIQLINANAILNIFNLQLFYIFSYYFLNLNKSLFMSFYTNNMYTILNNYIISVKLNSLFNFNKYFINYVGFYSIFNTLFYNYVFTYKKFKIKLENFIFIDWFNINFLNTIYNLFHQYIKYIIICTNNIVNLNILNNIHILFENRNVNIISLLPTINIDNYTNKFNFNNINRRMITQSLFMLLRYQIEKSISIYTQQSIYLNFSISFKKNPFIISAKLINDALVYLLQSGNKIVQSFFFIKNWQSALYASRRKLEYIYILNSKRKGINLNYIFFYAIKRFPLIGIRIECSGTFKKGRMSKVYYYNSWIKNDVLTGKMPNNTMIADIDYYQYVALTKSSSIGVKVWIFLETYIYNDNHKYISIIY